MDKPRFFTQLDGREAELSDLSGHGDFGESLTVQSQAEDVDLNVLMRRQGILGMMPQNPRIPSYGDFEDVTDFKSALDAINAAREGFAELPAEVRARFANDPQMLLDFMENPGNLDEARKLGLVNQEKIDERRNESVPQVGKNVGVAPGAAEAGVK